MEIQEKEPHLRKAQKMLAKCIITDLHGEDEYLKALNISECLFSDKIWTLSSDEIISSIKDVPRFDITQEMTILDLLVNNKIVSSKREGREMLMNGAISINNIKVTDTDKVITKEDAIDKKVILLRKGKKNYYLGIMN